MVALLTRMPVNGLVAENAQSAPNTWPPRKWPPCRAGKGEVLDGGGRAGLEPFEGESEVEGADGQARVAERVRDIEVLDRVVEAAVDGNARSTPGGQRGHVLDRVVGQLAAGVLVLSGEQREAVVTGGPGLVVRDQVALAAVGEVDPIGEHVPDPHVGEGRGLQVRL